MELWIKLSLLSILQGVAEFLPISSSGHLVLLQSLLGINSPGEDLEILLHAGTMLSIVCFYRQMLWSLIKGFFSWEKPAVNTIITLAMSTIPAIIFYVLFRNSISFIYENPKIVGGLLLATGAMLLSLRFIPKKDRDISIPRALAIGAAQAIAILPGISRSGSTIVCARSLGVAPEKAAAFSFIMSLPLIAGATAMMALGLTGGEETANAASAIEITLPMQLFAFALSAAVGYFSLKILVKMLKMGVFWFFGIYCLVVGLCAIFFI